MSTPSSLRYFKVLKFRNKFLTQIKVEKIYSFNFTFVQSQYLESGYECE